MKHLLVSFAAIVGLSGCASQKPPIQKPWHSQAASKVIRVLPGETWSQSIYIADISGLSDFSVFKSRPTQANFGTQLDQALFDAGLRAPNDSLAEYSLSVHFETVRMPDEQWHDGKRLVVTYALAAHDFQPVYQHSFDATGLTSEALVSSFMSDVSAKLALPVYELLPCGGGTQLRSYKTSSPLRGDAICRSPARVKGRPHFSSS